MGLKKTGLESKPLVAVYFDPNLQISKQKRDERFRGHHVMNLLRRKGLDPNDIMPEKVPTLPEEHKIFTPAGLSLRVAVCLVSDGVSMLDAARATNLLPDNEPLHRDDITLLTYHKITLKDADLIPGPLPSSRGRSREEGVNKIIEKVNRL